MKDGQANGTEDVVDEFVRVVSRALRKEYGIGSEREALLEIELAVARRLDALGGG